VQFPDFVVASGEEASDPIVFHDGQLVRVDELRASNHLAHQDDDLHAVAELGVRWWRYGMPWRLTEPEPGRYDWSLWDRALDACDRHGLVPIVDLCHFGLPDHYPGFCDATWVEGFMRYVDAFLGRFREPMFFTPVNEPMITASLSALMGGWNDRRSTRTDYAAALGHVTLANLEALARVSADRNGWWIGAEGFTAHVAATDADETAADDARALEQLVWDLHFGVEPRAQVADVVDAISSEVRARIDQLAMTMTSDRVVAGHDFYPVSFAVHGRQVPLTIDERVAAYEREARAWFARYGRPFWVAETSNLGLDVADGPRWLASLVDGLDRLIADDLPVRGICWYSRGDQYDWQSALLEPVGAVTEVGLFDAARAARPVAADYARLATRHG
jgi:hypothetical protein